MQLQGCTCLPHGPLPAPEVSRGFAHESVRSALIEPPQQKCGNTQTAITFYKSCYFLCTNFAICCRVIMIATVADLNFQKCPSILKAKNNTFSLKVSGPKQCTIRPVFSGTYENNKGKDHTKELFTTWSKLESFFKKVYFGQLIYHLWLCTFVYYILLAQNVSRVFNAQIFQLSTQ